MFVYRPEIQYSSTVNIFSDYVYYVRGQIKKFFNRRFINTERIFL